MTLKRRIEHAERFANLLDDLSHLSEAELDARIALANAELSHLTGGATSSEWNELLEHASQRGWSSLKVSAAKALVGVSCG